MVKVCVISDFSDPIDEGVKKFASEFVKALKRHREVREVLSTTTHLNTPDKKVSLKADPNFLNPKRILAVSRFRPRIIYYMPKTSGTVASLLRAKLLKLHAQSTKVCLIAAQPTEYPETLKPIVSLLKPDYVFSQSAAYLEAVQNLNWRGSLIQSGVDFEQFCPVASEKKLQLRQKYGLPLDKFIVLHVGHINPNRNLQTLISLQKEADVQVLIVGSTSTKQDQSLLNELESAGVKCITTYLDRIEEAYQLSDLYLFPTIKLNAAINFPLSVLEAMASNLPVVTTRFGGIAQSFEEGEGLSYFDTPDELLAQINAMKQKSPNTRQQAKAFSWETITETIFRQTKELIAGYRSPQRKEAWKEV